MQSTRGGSHLGASFKWLWHLQSPFNFENYSISSPPHAAACVNNSAWKWLNFAGVALRCIFGEPSTWPLSLSNKCFAPRLLSANTNLLAVGNNCAASGSIVPTRSPKKKKPSFPFMIFPFSLFPTTPYPYQTISFHFISHFPFVSVAIFVRLAFIVAGYVVIDGINFGKCVRLYPLHRAPSSISSSSSCSFNARSLWHDIFVNYAPNFRWIEEALTYMYAHKSPHNSLYALCNINWSQAIKI